MDELRAQPFAAAEERLSKLKRPELQKLAKEAGVKANVKNVDIIASLLQLLKEQHQDDSIDVAVETAQDKHVAPAAAEPLPDEVPILASAEDDLADAAARKQPSDVAADAAGSSEQENSDAAAEQATAAASPAAPASPATAPAVSSASAVQMSETKQQSHTASFAAGTAGPASMQSVSVAPAPALQPTTSAADKEFNDAAAAGSTEQPLLPVATEQPSPSLIAEARAMAEQVRTASKRPMLRTPARTPARVSLAASALGNRLRNLTCGTLTAAEAPPAGRSLLFDGPASSAASPDVKVSGSGSAASTPVGRDSDEFCLRRGSTGADTALATAMASEVLDASHDLSPGLLTMPVVGGGTPAGASWQGATEAQLREMERAWDDYKAGSPGWRAPSPATVAAKSASLAAAGFTTVSTPLAKLPAGPVPTVPAAAAAAAPTPVRAPAATPVRKPLGRLQPHGAGEGTAYPKTPKTTGKPSKMVAPSSVSRIPPPTPTGSRIPRPSPGTIKGPGRAAALAAQRLPGPAKSQRVEEALAARRTAAAARWQQ